MQIENIDIVIIGAGLSGIGAACHMSKQCPQKNVVILENRKAMGGTWDLFRYPGIRSDSDMFTLGYNFKPWTESKTMADGESIRNYIIETAEEHKVDKKIRYRHKVISASWSSEDALWTLDVETQHEQKQLKCKFMLCCTGYYSYEKGFTPEFKDSEKFKGQIVHPQHWPENLDYTNKKVVIIGSGATAITLLPSIAEKTAHTTMLQRSPSYILPVPQKDPMPDTLRKFFPEKLVYKAMRTRNIALSMALYQYSRQFPEKMKAFLRTLNKRLLPAGYDMKHFTPKYNPWDERLCATPDADFFKSIKEKKASIVTDHIESFDKTGIQLKSGEHLDADIIITATGLNVQLMSNISLKVDNKKFKLNNKMFYHGILIEQLPNMGMVFGSSNASWTLQADLTTGYICRLLNHMDKKGLRKVVAVNKDSSITPQPFINLQSSYVKRAKDIITLQNGSRLPWKLYQNYSLNLVIFKTSTFKDKALEFK